MVPHQLTGEHERSSRVHCQHPREGGVAELSCVRAVRYAGRMHNAVDPAVAEFAPKVPDGGGIGEIDAMDLRQPSGFLDCLSGLYELRFGTRDELNRGTCCGDGLCDRAPEAASRRQ